MRIDTIDPTSEPAWEEFIAHSSDATVFHTTAWAKVLHETYGFRPRYLVARNGTSSILAGVPFVETRGRRLVGLPFSDHCSPLVPDGAAGSAVLDAAMGWVRDGSASSVELRGPGSVDLEARGLSPDKSFVHHIVPLDAGLAELESRCHTSTRRGVRHAIRAGVTVRHASSRADMHSYYALHTLTRKKHGLLPQPWRFFDRIYEHFIACGDGYLLLAEHEGRIVGGDVLLVFADTILDKFNASDPASLGLRPNNLLHHRTMELGLEIGCRKLDLGRSEADADGLRRFKTNQGGIERELPYYHYPAEQSRGAVADASSLPRRLLSFAVGIAPLWVLRGAGSVLYKYAA